MKSIFVLTALFVAFANSAPSDLVQADAEFEVSADDIKHVESFLAFMKPKGSPDLVGKLFSGVLVEPTDKTCVVNNLKKVHLYEKFSTQQEPTPYDYVFFALSFFDCNQKLDGFIGLWYDLSANFGTLYQIFKESVAFQKLLEPLNCLNKHAVEKNLLDASVFNVTYNILNEERCDKFIKQLSPFEDVFDDLKKHGGSIKCIVDGLTELSDFNFKFEMILHQKLTYQQKYDYKKEYVTGFRKILTKLITCAEVRTPEDEAHVAELMKKFVEITPTISYELKDD